MKPHNRKGRKPGAFKRLSREQGTGEANVIGKRLRLARQFCRSGAMTADELVTKILLERQFDIDKNAISKIETQKRGVQDYEVKLFAEMLDVSADWLLGLTDNGGPERLSEGATR